MTKSPLLFLLAALLCGCDSNNSNSSATDVATTQVDAGVLRLQVTASPWAMHFVDDAGDEILREVTDTTSGRVGALGIFPGPPAPGSGAQAALDPLVMGEPSVPPERDQGWVRATELRSSSMDGDTWVGIVATTDPAWTLEVRARAQSEGVISVSVSANGGTVQASGISFAASDDERFVGFGERGNAVNQAGKVLENYVAEGPYQDSEYALINLLVPRPGVRWRPDTTYFPVPWLLSSRGYGVLLDNDEISYHQLAIDGSERWSMEVESAQLNFRVFAGPQPADALRRFTQVLGTQPHDYAPWFFGPWVQSDSDARIDEMRAADVPTSVTATYTHYLPCGSQRGNEDAQRERTAARNAAGTAVHTYFNPMICVDYKPEFDIAESNNALLKKGDGETYIYDYQTSRTFAVSQFDFSSPIGIDAYRTLTDEAIAHGYEGWMEDFGEYTPLDAVSADGVTGTAFHNRYARDYHCGVAAATSDAGKPLARFVRSGWTGSAACSPIVWGGDPTVSYGFDGLKSSLYQALSMGTSGVGLWGSDIGGFFAFPPNTLNGDLFDRWIEFGALSVVMRSQKDGLALGTAPRPQPWDDEHIALWRKYAKLHTQLYPYLQAAAEDYYATGMPIMRHHLLTNPDDAQAHARDDQYLFGPDILVAPVVEAGATERSLYLPTGKWIEWWRSVAYTESDGSFSLRALRLHTGGSDIVVDAPRDEIPLFVRAGAIIALTAPQVYTLAEHGAGDDSVVRLTDLADQLHLLAFPRGTTSGKYFDTGSYTSQESGGSWTLTVDDPVPRLVSLQANLQSLESPFTPCTVRSGDDKPDDYIFWHYDAETGVLNATFPSDAGALTVEEC
ncbi:MAG: glycoside hydrolase family 31 protein [Halioglobus sp.]